MYLQLFVIISNIFTIICNYFQSIPIICRYETNISDVNSAASQAAGLKVQGLLQNILLTNKYSEHFLFQIHILRTISNYSLTNKYFDNYF